MRRPLRVEVVNPFGVLGGAERWLLDVLDHTDRLRVHATVLEDGPLVTDLRDRGIAVHVDPTGPRATHVAAAGWRLARALRQRRPDVVLANGVKAAAVAVPAGRVTGTRVVWAKHDFAHDARLAGPLGRWTDGVVAVSDAVAAATGRDDVTIAPPVAAARPVDRATATRFWRDRGVPVGAGPTVAVVSRLLPVKGVDDAIRALQHRGAAPWSLVVVGPDDPTAPGERQRLRRLADDLGVAERVAFAGWVPDAARWLAAFDAVAVLTRTDAAGFGREGFGMTALEALRAGVPVVGVNDSPQVARLAGLAGRLVPPGAPDRVAAAPAHQPEHRGQPRPQHPDEDGELEPHAGRPLRDGPRPRHRRDRSSRVASGRTLVAISVTSSAGMPARTAACRIASAEGASYMQYVFFLSADRKE